MCEHLILHKRSVIEDEDLLDGECGDFGEEDAAKSIGDGGIDAYEGEGGV